MNSLPSVVFDRKAAKALAVGVKTLDLVEQMLLGIVGIASVE